ncbi:hypothetical protein HID58_052151 [Brassica napus]|uniref:Uncharacterized protein n=1 Tax=Brassica napus TaxID=3708 RepID=A0ABQ8AAY4_BRANA|nr:hypothetical protein HID58_052151 [Brassica napus]
MMNITAQETVLLKQCQGFLSRYCVEMTVSDDSAVFVGFAMQWRNIPASAVSQNVKKGHDNACSDISTLGVHNANLWCQLPCRLFYFNSQINKFSNNYLFMGF